jgi:hypothetical protein
VDATFQTPLTLSSPNNPAADANGNIFVTPGNHIPAQPQRRFKAGVDYAITEAWKLGADVNVVGSQYLICARTGHHHATVPWLDPHSTRSSLAADLRPDCLKRSLRAAWTLWETPRSTSPAVDGQAQRSARPGNALTNKAGVSCDVIRPGANLVWHIEVGRISLRHRCQNHVRELVIRMIPRAIMRSDCTVDRIAHEAWYGVAPV